MRRSALFAVITLVALAGCTATDGTGLTEDTTGRTVFGVTDAAADMGAVSSVEVTIESVHIHSESRGWVTVSDAVQTYDLLDLKASGETALLADVDLPNGSYQQLRFNISDVVVTDTEGTHEAMLPSAMLRYNTQLTVEPEETATLTLDFHADRSLHVTGDGTYILAPVITTTTRSGAAVQVRNGRVTVDAGAVVHNVTVGMDAQGNVGANARIPGDANLSVQAGGSAGAGGDGSGVEAGAGAEITVN